MVANLEPVEELRALARAKARPAVNKSVSPSHLDASLAEGWRVVKQGRTSIRLSRDKEGGERLVDRVWTLLYRLGVQYLSTDPTEVVATTGTGPDVDIAAVDSEVALAIACVSEKVYGKSSKLQSKLELLFEVREKLFKAVGRDYPADYKRNGVLCVFLENVQISDAERSYADAHNIAICDDSDLDYYEKLAEHLGSAAKYQLYADLLPGKAIPGLEIRVPAVRTRMGPQWCLTFPISPEYLLKIAYVSHRSKGKASDVDTYQRMLKKSRLNKIREYITARGVFPTNIVVNIDKKYIKFERVHQSSDRQSTDASGVLGWLTIRPAYKSAWVIDGQHRLFAYSGHEFAKTGHLSVLAFEGIPPSAQAQLFVDINAKQKSVKSSLLQELFAELHWDAESPSVRVQAIISKAVQLLDFQKDSPFMGRIQTADASKDSLRCISLASLFRALERHDYFIVREEHNEVVTPGPFWAGSSDKVLERTVFIIKRWFGAVAAGAPDWWALGAAPGGGLAMNDSVVACVSVMGSVLDHIGGKLSSGMLTRLQPAELWKRMEPYAEALGRHFGRFSPEERQRYRDLRGSQGQTTRARRAQQAIKAEFPDFDPPGLEDFLRREKAQTNLKGKEVIDRLEVVIQKIVVGELKQEFGPADWWNEGVPRNIRTELVARAERDDNRRGSREAYLELIEYRTIVQSQWSLFQKLMGFGKKSESKDKQTKWFVDLNDMRRIVAHSSSGVTLSIEQLSELEQIERTLSERMRRVADEDGDDGAIEEESEAQ